MRNLIIAIILLSGFIACRSEQNSSIIPKPNSPEVNSEDTDSIVSQLKGGQEKLRQWAYKLLIDNGEIDSEFGVERIEYVWIEEFRKEKYVFLITINTHRSYPKWDSKYVNILGHTTNDSILFLNFIEGKTSHSFRFSSITQDGNVIFKQYSHSSELNRIYIFNIDLPSFLRSEKIRPGSKFTSNDVSIDNDIITATDIKGGGVSYDVELKQVASDPIGQWPMSTRVVNFLKKRNYLPLSYPTNFVVEYLEFPQTETDTVILIKCERFEGMDSNFGPLQCFLLEKVGNQYSFIKRIRSVYKADIGSEYHQGNLYFYITDQPDGPNTVIIYSPKQKSFYLSDPSEEGWVIDKSSIDLLNFQLDVTLGSIPNKQRKSLALHKLTSG